MIGTQIAGMCLGRAPTRHDKRTLKMEDIVSDQLMEALKRRRAPAPAVPDFDDWGAKISDWGMMKNDERGCCTIATAGHMIMAWTSQSGATYIPTDDQIMAAYEDPATGGYVPGKPETDNGANELDVLNFWRKTGIAGTKIYGYMAVQPQNHNHVEAAIDLFGGAYTGFALPISAQNQDVWDVPAGGPVGPGSPGSWGLHAVPIVKYDISGLWCVTWGRLKKMTWRYWFTYCEEAYGVLSPLWADPDYAAPSGFDLPSLQGFLNQL